MSSTLVGTQRTYYEDRIPDKGEVGGFKSTQAHHSNHTSKYAVIHTFSSSGELS